MIFAPHAIPRSAVFATVLLIFSIAGCERESAPPSMDDVRAEVAPTHESWDVSYFVTETATEATASRPRLTIHAEYMATFETEDSTYTIMRGDSLERLTAHFFDEEGDTSATLHADRLILFDDDHRFEARGNVVVNTHDDKTLESEHLVWFEEDRELRTPGYARIRTSKERVQGYDLVADENLETYTLRRMTGEVTVEEDE